MISIKTITPKDSVFRVLSSVAISIVAGLVPNAILGEISKYFMDYHSIFKTLLGAVVATQFTVPVLTGALITMRFDPSPLAIAVMANAAYVGGGAVQFKNGAWMITGTGGLINTMITAATAALFISLIQHRAGDMALIIFPTAVGGISDATGVLILPYTKMITTVIDNMVNGFTELQSIVTSILISVVFSFTTISPLSTVATAFAIGTTGLAAGSASIGISAAEAALMISTNKVNRLGVSLPVSFGGVKMMAPNVVKYPILMLPILTTAIISGLVSASVGIHGTKESAGSGFIGMMGPINAFKFMEVDPAWSSVLLVVVAFFVVPFVTAWLADIIYRKVFRLYTDDIFRFME